MTNETRVLMALGLKEYTTPRGFEGSSEVLAWRRSHILSLELRVKASEVIEKLVMCPGTESSP